VLPAAGTLYRMPKKLLEEDFSLETDRVLDIITQSTKGVNDWLDKANCADIETDEFFLELNKGASEEVLRACLNCSVRKECIEMIGTFEILDKRPGKGIFAGMSGNARATYILPYAKEEWEARTKEYIENKLFVRSKEYLNQKKRERRLRAKARKLNEKK
jgi:hypothetical protein